MLCKPFSGVMCMETMIAIDTEDDESAHDVGLCGFALLLTSIGGDTRPGHWIWGAHPERANSTTGHRPSTPGANHS
jgi:hypothetical protein